MRQLRPGGSRTSARSGQAKSMEELEKHFPGIALSSSGDIRLENPDREDGSVYQIYVLTKYAGEAGQLE